MISTLHSIDSLLNKFDELSKCHANLLSNFDKNFSEIKNPLKSIARTDDEQRKSKENILLNLKENNQSFESSGSLEDFHRRTIKSRFLYRPPCYSSNDSPIIQRFSSRSDLTSLPKISLSTTKENNLKKNIIEPKVDLIKNNKPHNSPSPRRNVITTFTMQTINRLSKPKRYNRLPEQKSSIKRVKQQSKSYQNMKKEPSKCIILPSIKQTNTKPSSKKLKPAKKIQTQTIKKNLVNNFTRSLVFLAPPPTIRLHFPTQTQQKSSRIVNLPKLIATVKRPTIHVKT